MKIEGVTPGKAKTEVITLKRPDGDIPLTFQPIPMGFEEKMEEMIPSPAPPKAGYARTDTGKLLRDEKTNKPVIVYDEDNVEYRHRRDRVNRLHTILMLMESLKADPNVSFESKRENFKDAEQWAAALYEEFKNFGFSMGELAQMVDAVVSLSNITPDIMREARERFLSEKP